MVTVVVIEFGVMRCQPLRRALGDSRHQQVLIVIMRAFVINL
ncbi:acetyltransferase [Vibrio mimicus]